jgi:hypothetical protein
LKKRKLGIKSRFQRLLFVYLKYLGCFDCSPPSFRIPWGDAKMKTGFVLTAVALALLCDTVLAANVFAVGPTENVVGHPPEVESHPGEPTHVRLTWVFLGSSIGVIVFCIIHDIYNTTIGKMVRTWLEQARRPWILSPTRWSAFGRWVDSDQGAVLRAYSAIHKAWELTLRDESYNLLIDTVTSEKGIASGQVVCAQAGHLVGTWAISPCTANPNRFTLEFQLDGRPKLLLRLSRPR